MDLQTQKPSERLEQQTRGWIKSVCGRDFETVTAVMESREWAKVEAALLAGIERANTKAVSNVARIKKFRVLKTDFSVDGGELSPTLKLKRSVVAKMYEDVIEEMYKE